MPERYLLTDDNLDAFRSYMEGKGWTSQPLKSPHEVARFTHPDRMPVIVFRSLRGLTVQDKDFTLVRRFLRTIGDEQGFSRNALEMRDARMRARGLR